MIFLTIILLLLFLCAATALFVLFRIYRITFYSKQKRMPDVGNALSKDQYENLKSTIDSQIEEYTSLPYKKISVKAYDGITLNGRLYVSDNSKQAIIIFHGYKSNINKDASIITKHCLDRGFNVIVVNQRGHGESGGRSITFGIKERFDCRSWVDGVIDLLGNNAKIILYGISMGGATVMSASSFDMPNVKGIISDCGFSSPEAMLRSVLDSKGAPTDKVYPLLRTSARIFAGFDPNKTSAVKELSNSTIPIRIIHSDGDKFVPLEMGKECYSSAKADNKKLIIIKNAGHALSYFFDKDNYIAAVDDMLDLAQ